MKKTLLILALVALVVNAQAVINVGYLTKTKTTLETTATTVQNDPIIQMLKNDPNINLTVIVQTAVTATDVITGGLSPYDVVIIQESFGGGDGILQPTGALALKTISKPFIYNKCYALQKSRALSTSTSTGAGKEADGTVATGTLLINVEASQSTNDLFKACTLNANNQIQLFNALSNDNGLLGNTASVKAINYTTGLTAIPGTLLAQPAVLNGGLAVSVCVNDVPAGTAIDGTETTISRGIFFGMNFGAISANGGKNITDDALTMWRNAVYILAGQTVPTTKPLITTGFNNQPNASTFSFDGKVVRNTNSEVLNVFNVTGKLISTSNKDIDMSNLAKGVYFVKGQNNTLKVSVQ